MKKAFCALSLFLVLPGCELLLLPLAPLALPMVAMDMAQTRSSITQPITVRSAGGSDLAGPIDPDRKPEGVFTVPNRALTCKGSVKSSSKTKEPVQIPVRCSNGLKGAVAITSNELVGYKMSFWIGPTEAPTTACVANFYLGGPADGPFQVGCNDISEEWTDFNRTKKEAVKLAPRNGAAQVSVTSSGTFQATVWVPKGS